MPAGRAVDPLDSAVPCGVPCLLDHAVPQPMRVQIRRQIEPLVEGEVCSLTCNLMAKSPQRYATEATLDLSGVRTNDHALRAWRSGVLTLLGMRSLVEPPRAPPPLELLATLVEPLFHGRVVLGGPGTAEPREDLLDAVAGRQVTVAIEQEMCFHRHRGVPAGGAVAPPALFRTPPLSQQ